jgi:flagellar motor switch protein FliN/FliY
MENDSGIEISAEELADLAKETGLDVDLDIPPTPAAGTTSPNSALPTAAQSAGSVPFTPQMQAQAAPPEGGFSSRAQVPVQPAAFMPLETQATPPAAEPERNIDFLLDISMKVSVELGRTRMDIRDILSLSTGSVVELDRQAGEPVDILINGRLVARGEVVVIDDRFGVRVTDIESPAQRVRTLR